VEAQRGGERPCDANVTFRCGAVTHARCSDGRDKPARLGCHPFGKRVGAGVAQHVGRLRLLLALHRGIPHDLLNARLIHRELRQMLFSGYVRRRHLSKLFLHPLKNKART
jgi:hypothetical protein